MPMLAAEDSLEMTLVRRDGSPTRWLEGSCSAGSVPLSMFEDFRAAGWRLRASLIEEVDNAGDALASCRTVLGFTITRPGSDFHEGWTEIEALRNLRQANEILVRHGRLDVPTRTPRLLAYL